MVRVRIAPSPTGFAHVGTAYTALFNYAFAKKEKGKFIVRLEDTDIEREVKGAEEAIYKGLSWLNLSWDEGPDKGGEFAPYRQSERLTLYKKKAKELLEKGLVYEDEGAIRFKNPGEDIGWKDMVRGDVKFPGGEVTDFVILKSNGYPTYNFAVVIDDIEMEITHVIRGEEHISNTPRQIAIYKALNVKIPEFGHLPTLRNKDRKKLSKRRDPVDLRYFQSEGYLPEALVNFLCLLGWSHPEEKEIFSLTEFVEKFDMGRVRKSGPIFDTDKLDWINGEYIRALSIKDLKEKIMEFFSKKYDEGLIEKILPLIQSRIKTLKEFEGITEFFFESPKIDKKLFGKKAKDHVNLALKVLEGAKTWKAEKLGELLVSSIEEEGFKTGEFFMDLRIAVTGKKVSPPFNESVEILGRDETLKRLKSAL